MSQTPHHLLNTSWTLHRLSPLHHGKEFQTLLDNPTALNTYAARLRDQLTGDVLSGLQTGLGGGVAEDDTVSKTGALRACTWEAIPQFDDTFTSSAQAQGQGQGQGQMGILITLSYETTTYKAALLTTPDTQPQNARKGVTPLPLLLTRLPTPLRQTLLTFLSTTFDTYPSPLRLPAPFMCNALDTYVITFLSSGARDAADILEGVVRDVQLTLAFSGSVAPSLKSLGVGVPRGMVGGFLRGSGDGEGFLGRVEGYLEAHLAMKLDLSTTGNGNGLAKQHVRVSKIACGGFVIGSEGRMKLSADLRRQDDDTGDGDGGQSSQVLSEKEKLELRASHALLLGVLRRAVAGEGQMK